MYVARYPDNSGFLLSHKRLKYNKKTGYIYVRLKNEWNVDYNINHGQPHPDTVRFSVKDAPEDWLTMKPGDIREVNVQ